MTAIANAVSESYEDETLYELFANLLANAFSNRTAAFVLPDFISLVSRLTPAEAFFIWSLFNRRERQLPLIKAYYEVGFTFDKSNAAHRMLAFDNIVAPTGKYESLTQTDLTHISLCVNHLKSLGIIREEPEFYNKTDEFVNARKAVEQLEFIVDITKSFSVYRERVVRYSALTYAENDLKFERVDFNTYKLCFTDFGFAFAQVALLPPTKVKETEK